MNNPWIFAPISMLAVAAACATTQANEDDIAIPLTSSTIEAKAPPPEEVKKDGELDEDTKEQIKVALRRGGEKAQECNKAANANVIGEGEVDVVVDGKQGKVVDAVVGAPFAGTAVENCIKNSFIGEFALVFEGTLHIPYAIKLAGKAAVDPKKKDPKKK